MLSGGQEFVLAIIGIATFGGVIKHAIAAKHGFPLGGPARRGRNAAELVGHGPAEADALRNENRRLTDQVETMQDRLVVLERIVTDRGYNLAAEIEALRDRPRPSAGREIERND